MTELLPRHLEPVAREAMGHSPVVIVEGARQVGKSTFARMIAPEAEFLTLDRQSVRDAAAADPDGFVAQPGTLIIDEIQHLPELTLAIKAAVDEDRRPGRFLLTGSASLLRVRGLTDSLAGRARRLTLFGLSEGEAAQTDDDFIARLCEAGCESEIPRFTTQVAREDYVELLVRGSYPEARFLPPRVRSAWLDDYVEGVIGRDLSDIRRQVQPARARSLLRILAARQSEELVKGPIAELAGLPSSTVTGYLDLLADVHLHQPLPPWSPNLVAREVGRSKVHVNDTALCVRLAGITALQLNNRIQQELFGRLLEGLVTSELRKQQTWSQQDFQLFHYRTRDGLEVDLIAELADGRVLAFEIKASTSYNGKQFAGLAALRDRLGDRFLGGFVLGTAGAGYRYAPKLWGLPISAIWEWSNVSTENTSRPDTLS